MIGTTATRRTADIAGLRMGVLFTRRQAIHCFCQKMPLQSIACIGSEIRCAAR